MSGNEADYTTDDESHFFWRSPSVPIMIGHGRMSLPFRNKAGIVEFATGRRLVSTTTEDRGMGLAGKAMFALGGLLMLIGFFMSGSQEDADVYNIGLLNMKGNLVVAGGLIAVCGSVFYAAAQIARALPDGVDSMGDIARNVNREHTSAAGDRS